MCFFMSLSNAGMFPRLDSHPDPEQNLAHTSCQRNPRGSSSHWLMCVAACRAPREPVARGVFDGVEGTSCQLRIRDEFATMSSITVSVCVFVC